MNWLLQKVKGWKTVLVNTVFAIIPLMQLAEVAALIPPKYMPWYSLLVVLSNLWLRKVTTTPLGGK